MAAPHPDALVAAGGVAVAVAAVVGVFAYLHVKDAQARPTAVPSSPVTVEGELVVPEVATPVKIDGELDQKDWHAAARSGAFHDPSGAELVPYSDARFLWGPGVLYVGLYAADADLRSDRDRFSVSLSAGGKTVRFAVDPACRLHGAEGLGVRVGCDMDGTLDKEGDDDEEWLAEMAIPLASIGAEKEGHVEVSVRRDDASASTAAMKTGDTGPLRLTLAP